jgi:hypothetical protein
MTGVLGKFRIWASGIGVYGSDWVGSTRRQSCGGAFVDIAALRITWFSQFEE